MAETSFKIMSHASLLFKRNDTSIIIDPWLVGSCYWRSWWNIPEPVPDKHELMDVNYVIISHIHWDHWHGPSIRKYFRGNHFLLPDDPNMRSYRDLKSIGERSVERVKHGQTINLGNDVLVTIYQFGLYLNDAAIVVETPEIRILNANDAKIAGHSLRQILKNHGGFDFAFRSHSSANARVCFYQRDSPEKPPDDDKHYARSFKLFMDKVQPRYAVPFASNHCHLHKDTFKFNKIITNPVKLRKQLEELGGLATAELKIMLPGSTWSSECGFNCSSESVFHNLDSYLADYEERMTPKLEEYYKKEEAVPIDEKLIFRYFKLLDRIPPWKQWKFKDFTAVYEFRYPSGKNKAYKLTPFRKQVSPASEKDIHESRIVISFPAIVFRDAVLRNMFAHARISKRCRFIAEDKAAMSELKRFLALHSRLEFGLYPISMRYMSRFSGGYLRRWREVFVYCAAAWHLHIRKRPEYEVEERILKDT